MPFVHVNGVKLHYEIEGSGPLLLLIPGTGLPGATWRIGPSAQYAACRYLAEHIPGAELKTVEGSAHMLFWQGPVETCSAIVEFLRRHGSASH